MILAKKDEIFQYMKRHKNDLKDYCEHVHSLTHTLAQPLSECMHSVAVDSFLQMYKEKIQSVRTKRI